MPILPSTPMNEKVACILGEDLSQVYSILTPAPDVEAISFYVGSTFPTPADAGAADGGASGLISRGTIGSPCSEAACEAARDAVANTFAQIPSAMSPRGWEYFDKDPSFDHGFTPRSAGFAVVRKGGVHTLVVSLDALRPFLAPIETIAEAQAWATLNGKGASCESNTNASAGADFFDLREIVSGCGGLPGGGLFEVIYRVYRDGRIEQLQRRQLQAAPPNETCPAAGRLPADPVASDRGTATSPATYLAQIAHLEAEAVLAFGELAQELTRFGAPTSLIERARKAEQDEIRHAACMSEHAMKRGASVVKAKASPHQYATLLELALHNAREGCVRETYGALIALHQGQFAELDLRSDLQQIAQEEVEHAAWSHDLDRWLQSQLSAFDRARVEDAKRRALEILEHETEWPMFPELGLPNAETSRRLLAGLRAHLS